MLFRESQTSIVQEYPVAGNQYWYIFFFKMHSSRAQTCVLELYNTHKINEERLFYFYTFFLYFRIEN